MLRMVTAAGAAALVLGAAAPAGAAQAPNPHASCLGVVFQQQAVEAPRTVSSRIHEIRANDLQGMPFGQALKPLALGTFEFCP